jgi:SPOR domain
MKKTAVLFFVTIFCIAGNAQITPATDSAGSGKVVVNKDPRMEILAKKQAAHYSTMSGTNLGPRAARGYRLMVLSSNDRAYAMNVRAQLLQRYPEQKVYMSYQAPFIKLKFGNFVDKGDAEHYKRMIAGSKMVKNNIYVVSEIVEIKPVEGEEDDKDKKDKK